MFKGNKNKQYTKTMMDRIINVSLIDLQLPFILAYLGKENIAETLGGLIVSEIIAVFLVYCCKSYFETKQSENVRLQENNNMEETESAEAENEGKGINLLESDIKQDSEVE
jgi:Ca2+/H+ antiporter